MSSKNAAKRFALGALSVIALAPLLLLTRCGPKEPPPATASTSTASDSAATAASETVATEASTSPPLPKDTASAEAPSETAPPPPAPVAAEPAYTGPIPKDCASLEAAMKKAYADRACAKDADCGGTSAYCTCEFGMAKRSIAKANALNDAWEKKECYKKSPPRACPTCAPPKPHVCEKGRCT